MLDSVMRGFSSPMTCHVQAGIAGAMVTVQARRQLMVCILDQIQLVKNEGSLCNFQSEGRGLMLSLTRWSVSSPFLHLFVLPGASSSYMRPTPAGKGELHYLVYQFSCKSQYLLSHIQK